jgi:PAS domain S-box-containing protein
MNARKNVPKDTKEILIVEDSPTQAEQLKYLLEQHGYTVLAANSGKQALALIDKHKPLLVISDIVMPEMDGYELCRQIKSDKSNRDTPVILLTSLSNAEDVLDGLECGADNFITKPYNEEYLLLHIEQNIANRKLFKNERVRVGLEIMFGGKRRFVTADQQQMLTLLISTYEEAVRKNSELVKTQNMYKLLNERLEDMVEERTAALTEEIEARKKADERIRKLNRVYAMLSNINQAIVRIRETQALFKEACRIAVEDGGFKMAWIGLADPATGRIMLVASAGVTGDYLEKVHIVLGDETGGSFSIGRVVHSGKHFVWNDLEKDPHTAPWHKDVLSRGIRSFAAFPLKVSGQVRGALKLYAAEAGFFDEEELELLDELAMDISFAMEFAEKEAHRKLAEEALRESEERFRILFEQATDIILQMEITPEGIPVIREANSATFKILGYKPDELIGRPVTILNPESEDANIVVDRRQIIISGSGTVFEAKHRCKDNTIRDFECLGTEMRVGSKIFAITVERDITERKRLEKEKEQLQAQFNQSQKLEAIGQLSSGVAHDFNNLLGAIMGHAELLKMNLNPESSLLRHSEVIISSCQKAADLTKQLLTFARKAPIELQKIDLNAVIKQAIGLMERTIDHRVEIVVNLQEQPAFILGDRNLLENALLNIAINARDAMPEGGSLCITSESAGLNEADCKNCHLEVKEGRYVKVSITDTGAGMSKEVQEKIFEPFFTTKEAGKGTGLGLASVYGCVKQHNGHIAVESKEGVGTRFDLYFPVVEQGQSEGQKQEDTLLPGKGSLMVVDDETVFHDILIDIFTPLGYTMHCCAGGIEAVEYFRVNNSTIDVVILDMNMPKMSGMQCFKHLKEINPGVRVIIATGYGDNSEREALQKEGVRMFVQKPYNAAELSVKIRELMSAP